MNELTKINGKGLELTKDKIDLIRRTVAKDASDDELAMFLHIAKQYELDPFLKEILFIKRRVWNSYKQAYDEVPTIMIPRDGHMSVAHKSGQFGGMKTTPNFDEKGILVSSTCKVWNKSCTEPIEVTVYFKEYCAYNKDGKAQALWGTKPITMLNKVSESQALRKAFNFHGVYSPEEMEAEIQRDPQTELGYLKETIKLSEDINAGSYDEWVEKIKVKILDDILACQTTQELSHVKKQYEADIGRLMDEDRGYINDMIDNAFQNIVSGDKGLKEGEIEIQGDGSTKEGPKASPEAPGAQIQGEKDPVADLKEREIAGQAFLKQVVAEIALCSTKAQLTMLKNKSISARMKLLPDQKDYFDAILKEAFAKVK